MNKSPGRHPGRAAGVTDALQILQSCIFEQIKLFPRTSATYAEDLSPSVSSVISGNTSVSESDDKSCYYHQAFRKTYQLLSWERTQRTAVVSTRLPHFVVSVAGSVILLPTCFQGRHRGAASASVMRTSALTPAPRADDT